MNDPLVSIIVPTSNRLAFLKQAIASIRTQTFRDWELIVSDNGSTDGTVEWLSEQDDVILLTDPIRIGGGEARNRAIEIARGRFVACLDDDDMLLPTALESLLRLDSNNSCFAVAGARMRPTRAGQYQRLWHPTSVMERDVWQEVLAEWNPVPSQMLFKRDVLNELGGFPSELWPSDDRALVARAAMSGHSLLLVPEPVCLYRVHPGQSASTRTRSDLLQRRRRILDPLADATSPKRRKKAVRLRAAGELWSDAEEEWGRSAYMKALRLYLKMCRTAPSLLRSPIYRPMIVWKIRRCLVELVTP